MKKSRFHVFGKTVKPRILSRKEGYRGLFFKVIESDVKYPERKVAKFNIPEFQDIVVVAPMEGKNVYLVNEWRPAYRRDVLQVPAGHCKYKTEAGRIKQVRNELKEEIGMDAEKITKLGHAINSSNSVANIHMYAATGLFKSNKAPDDTEFLEVLKMPIDRAIEEFTNGNEPTTAYSLACLFLAKRLGK